MTEKKKKGLIIGGAAGGGCVILAVVIILLVTIGPFNKYNLQTEKVATEEEFQAFFESKNMPEVPFSLKVSGEYEYDTGDTYDHVECKGYINFLDGVDTYDYKMSGLSKRDGETVYDITEDCRLAPDEDGYFGFFSDLSGKCWGERKRGKYTDSFLERYCNGVVLSPYKFLHILRVEVFDYRYNYRDDWEFTDKVYIDGDDCVIINNVLTTDSGIFDNIHRVEEAIVETIKMTLLFDGAEFEGMLYERSYSPAVPYTYNLTMKAEVCNYKKVTAPWNADKYEELPPLSEF